MAGIYVHIPFCKKRCLYCDFFSTTLLERQEAYIEAVIEEIKTRRDEAGEPIRTIYLGGGTPSTLSAEAIRQILAAIHAPEAEEVTMEMNPGDANATYLQALKEAGINRLSIGIQSFQDELLQHIGRRHSAQQAKEAVRMAQEAGFDNLSIDLMYALPEQTMAQWEEDITTALDLNIQHLSCYGLMYEPGTPLTQKMENGEIQATDEDTENAMYDRLCERMRQSGFRHYEVSNFALPGRESKHNSSYWDGTPYIGIGAGAHSYLPPVRSWNPDNLEGYINGIMAHSLQRESETLNEKDQYNEQVMLGLRTDQGVARSAIRRDIRPWIEAKLLRETTGRIVATQRALHILNRIIEDLMI